MKKLVVAFLVLMVGLAEAQAVSVDGFALFDNKTQHDSIQIVFERTAPGVYFDTTYTNTNGYYSKNILPGIYNIHCQAPGKLYRKDTILSFNCFSSVRIDTAILENYQLIGDLKGTITKGTYRIGGDIRVQVNDTLRIMPGVQLLFLPGFKFTVNGLLLAHGTANDSITFTSYKNNTRWGGIVFQNLCSAYQTNFESNYFVFKNCHISGSSDYGLNIHGKGYGIINIGTSMNVDGLNLFNNKKGIYLSYIDSSVFNSVNCYKNFGRNSYDYIIKGEKAKIKFNNLCFNNSNKNTDIYFYHSEISFINSEIKSSGDIRYHSNIIDAYHSNIIINNSKMISKKSGIIIKSVSNLKIINSLIEANGDEVIKSIGNGSVTYHSNIEIINSTIFNNYFFYTKGISIEGFTNLKCTNSIVYIKYGKSIYNKLYNWNTSNISVRNSIIYPFDTIYYYNDPWLFNTITTNANKDSCDAYFNLLMEPEFVDTANGDFRLKSTSPAIDAGINDSVTIFTDLDGNYRIWDGNGDSTAIVDIGCYEFNSKVYVKFGEDHILCAGDSVLLKGPPGFTSYDWNNGLSSNQNIWVKDSGTYYLTVTNNLNNSNTDSIKITMRPKPNISYLLSDTSLCYGGKLNLPNISSNAVYEWYDLFDNSYSYLENSGDYVLKVTDSNGCSGYSDTMRLTIFPKIDVVFDTGTVICENDSFKVLNKNNFVSFNWNNGLSSAPFVVVNTNKSYFVKATDTNNCIAYSDTVNLTTRPLPVVSLGNDRTMCMQDSVQLFAGFGFQKYLWNTGEKQSAIYAKSSGEYFVRVTDFYGCSNYSDTLEIINHHSTRPQLGADQTFCEGESIDLNAGTGYKSYKWNYQNTPSQIITVTNTGNYYVEVVDSYNCKLISDTVRITEIPLPQVFIGSDTSLCGVQQFYLFAGHGFAKYSWNNGLDTNSTFTVTQNGEYFVEVTDQYGCSNTSNKRKVTFNPIPISIIRA
jgi:hypothetical protein